MNPDLALTLRNQRKTHRELIELKNLLALTKQQKIPDQKLIKMIEDAIRERTLV